MPIKVLPPDVVLSPGSLVICALWHEHAFADDVRASCVDCGDDVGHRPHAPDVAKICMVCMQKRIDALPDEKRRQVTFGTTPQMLEELRYRGFDVVQSPKATP